MSVLTALRYAIVDVPPLGSRELAEFETLPRDPYTPGGHRFRRFSQYRLAYGDGWHLDLLPHRPFIQSREYNPLVGGVPRYLDPLRIDPTPQIAAGAAALGLDPAMPWQINVHQCRVVARRDTPGVSVPEGPHRDGHEFGMVAVFRRHNITGGETQLVPPGGGKPFATTILGENQAIVYDDAEMFHYATDIEPCNDGEGFRDLWIVAFNRWSNRRYGAEFETRAM